MMNISKETVRKWGIGLMSAGLLLGGGLLPSDKGYAASDQTKSKAIAASIALKANGVISQQTGILQEGKVWIPITFMRDVLQLPLTYDKKKMHTRSERERLRPSCCYLAMVLQFG